MNEQDCPICKKGKTKGRIEHRTVHIELPDDEERRRVMYAKFTDGAGIIISADVPDLAKTIGEWFLNEIDFLPDDLGKTCPTCGGLICDV